MAQCLMVPPSSPPRWWRSLYLYGYTQDYTSMPSMRVSICIDKLHVWFYICIYVSSRHTEIYIYMHILVCMYIYINIHTPMQYVPLRLVEAGDLCFRAHHQRGACVRDDAAGRLHLRSLVRWVAGTHLAGRAKGDIIYLLYLSIYNISIFIFISISRSISISIYLSLSIYLSIYVSIYLSIYLTYPIYLSVYPSIYLSIYLI